MTRKLGFRYVGYCGMGLLVSTKDLRALKTLLIFLALILAFGLVEPGASTALSTGRSAHTKVIRHELASLTH